MHSPGRLNILDAYMHRLPSGLCLKRITQNVPRGICHGMAGKDDDVK